MPLLNAQTRQRLETAYREQAARNEALNDSAAAKLARCGRHAAARQRQHGDEARGWKPIEALLEEEARARREQLASAARGDAANQMQEEIGLVRNIRVASSAMFRLCAQLLPGMLGTAQQLSDQLKAGALAGDPAAAMSALRQFVTVVGRASEIASTAQIAEHRMLGKPTDILAVRDESLKNATPEQAQAKAQEVLAVAERLKQLQIADEKEKPDDGGKLLN